MAIRVDLLFILAKAQRRQACNSLLFLAKAQRVVSRFYFSQRHNDTKVGVAFFLHGMRCRSGIPSLFSQSFGAVLLLRSLVLRACNRASFRPQSWNAILRPRYAIPWCCSSSPQPCSPSLQASFLSSTGLQRNPSASIRNPTVLFFISAAL